MRRSEFIKAIKEQFPELRKALNQRGTLCGEVEEPRFYAMQAIRDDDMEKVAACYRLVETAYLTGNRKFKDAIDVCFVEGNYSPHPRPPLRKGREQGTPALPFAKGGNKTFSSLIENGREQGIFSPP